MREQLRNAGTRKKKSKNFEKVSGKSTVSGTLTAAFLTTQRLTNSED